MMRRELKHIVQGIGGLKRSAAALLAPALALLATGGLLAGCVREPTLHLHYGTQVELELRLISLQLETFWDYVTETGERYDWTREWAYGWDGTDIALFGQQGYSKPEAFELRRYYTGSQALAPHRRVFEDAIQGNMYKGDFYWGFWDVLAWNAVRSHDGIQNLVFDEPADMGDVTASTNMSMRSSRYNAPRYTRSFFQPEELFSGYLQGFEINPDLEGFVFDRERGVWVKSIDMLLMPRTYIYLTQVILHNNNGKIAGIDGTASLSGMARSVNLNSGVAGSDAITVYYQVRFKRDLLWREGKVDIAGGRLQTFGLCDTDGSRVGLPMPDGGTGKVNDRQRHYLELPMTFNNGNDSTFVFDVTSQVRRRYKGGVITVELDMDTVPVPSASGGSGFNAVVVDYEDGGTHEFQM